MKRQFWIFLLFILMTARLFSQQPDFQDLISTYLGQDEPGLEAELFAPGLVSTGQGVHGNIVFNPDFTEAAWHPNYHVDGKSLIYIMKYKDGKWKSPIEFFPEDGHNYSEPFYSHDGKRLYYLSGRIGASGKAENETFYFVDRIEDGWSEPILLDPVFSSIQTHWQFSMDRKNNIYFGSKSADKKSEIYISKFRDGAYDNPSRLPETINTNAPEFSPCISPDDKFLIFTRLLEQEKRPPQMNLFISFRNKDPEWSEALNLTEVIGLPVQSPMVMMSQARITPDGKYLFFCFFNGQGHMVYWVDAGIIEGMRPNGG